MNTRKVWLRDSDGRPTRQVTLETFEDAVPTPPTWMVVVLVALFIAGVAWQGGIWW